MPRRAVVIGVGCDLRGDDAVGLEVARSVRDRGLPEDAGVELARSPIDAIELWAGMDLAIVVDACVSGAPPGTIHRIEGEAASFPVAPDTSASNHGFGVAEAVALGRVLDRMPARLVVIGVEAAEFGHGTPMSPEVTGAIDIAADLVMGELSAG